LLVTQAPFTLVLGDRPDSAPVIATMLETYEVTEATVVDIPLSATDSDGDEITFTVHPSFGLASWMELIDGGVGDDTAILRVSPQLGDAVVDYHVSFLATAHGLEDSVAFDVDVLEPVVVDSPPVLTPIIDNAAVENTPATIGLTAVDADLDPITLSVISGPAWLISQTPVSTGPTTWDLSFTPPVASEGVYPVTVQASANGEDVRESFNVVVDADGLLIVYDNFTDSNGVDLVAHDPNLPVPAPNWTERTSTSDFEITNGVARDAANNGAKDSRVVVDSGTAYGTVEAQITKNGGRKIGLAVRMNGSNDSQWISAWWEDGQVIVLRRNGGFSELGRGTGPSWANGETKQFQVVMDGTSIDVVIDGVTYVSVTDTQLTSQTHHGLFTFSWVSDTCCWSTRIAVIRCVLHV